MTLINQAQRSSVAAVAAISAAAAISVSALAAGPLSANSTWLLSASSVPAEISSAIHDVLVAAHTAVHGDRTDIAAERQTIRATRRDAVHAIGASVLTGAIGDGQIAAIVDTARSATNDARQAISTSRGDIHQTRQGAAADIRTIIAGSHDGSTVQDVKAIVDTAKKDNAMARSSIVADAQENASIRRATTSDDATIRQSARAGDISKQEAAQQLSAARKAAHTEITDNRGQMTDSHKQVKATRHQAAQDVAKAVHEGRTGE